MKKLVVSLFLITVGVYNIFSQTINDTLSINTNYQYLLVRYNENTIKLTNVITIVNHQHVLMNGFQNLEKFENGESYYIKGKNYISKYHKIAKIDTVNTVLWFDGKLPENKQDSVLFYKKIMYSFVLYKNNEKRLNEDNVVKVRLLVPEENIYAQGKWHLIKASFSVDSAVCITKLSDIIDSTGRKVIKTHAKKISQRKQMGLLKELNRLSKYKGYECLKDNYYPMLLEYYDGNIEHTYIISNRCKIDNDLKHLYENVISKLWNL